MNTQDIQQIEALHRFISATGSAYHEYAPALKAACDFIAERAVSPAESVERQAYEAMQTDRDAYRQRAEAAEAKAKRLQKNNAEVLFMLHQERAARQAPDLSTLKRWYCDRAYGMVTDGEGPFVRFADVQALPALLLQGLGGKDGFDRDTVLAAMRKIREHCRYNETTEAYHLADSFLGSNPPQPSATQKQASLRTTDTYNYVNAVVAKELQPSTASSVWNQIQVCTWIGNRLMHEPSMFERSEVCRFVRSLGRDKKLARHFPKEHVSTAQVEPSHAETDSDIFDLIRTWAAAPEGKRYDAARAIIGNVNKSYSKGFQDGKAIGEINTNPAPGSWKAHGLVVAIEELIAHIGAYGEIDSRHALVAKVMDEMYKLDADATYPTQECTAEAVFDRAVQEAASGADAGPLGGLIMDIPCQVTPAVFAEWTRAEQEAYNLAHKKALQAAAEIAEAYLRLQQEEPAQATPEDGNAQPTMQEVTDALDEHWLSGSALERIAYLIAAHNRTNPGGTPEGGQDLPPLPHTPFGHADGTDLWTADQMRDYARAAVAQQKEKYEC